MSPETAGFGLDRIGQIAINVHDTERAVAYYRDVLGMRLLFRAGPALAFFDCGGVRLMLGPASEPRLDHPASIIYYTVDDIRASFAAIAARGGLVEREPQLTANMGTYELWIGFLRDPEGNVLALMSEVPAEPSPASARDGRS
jgi:methylmalonyl-CoA/ethylmalonyl-CoA epimerase